MGEFKKVLHTDDESMILYTIDGITDYSPTKNTLTCTNCIVGNGMFFNDGTMEWEPIPNIQSYMYIFTNGSTYYHYAVAGENKYINSILTTDEFPCYVNESGLSSNITGKIFKLVVYNRILPQQEILLDFENESKYFIFTEYNT